MIPNVRRDQDEAARSVAAPRRMDLPVGIPTTTISDDRKHSDETSVQVNLRRLRSRWTRRSLFAASHYAFLRFLPLFTIRRTRDKFLARCARTYGYALAQCFIGDLRSHSCACVIYCPDNIKDTETIVLRALRRFFRSRTSICVSASRHRGSGGNSLFSCYVSPVDSGLGSEFLCRISEEGNFSDPRFYADNTVAPGR